MAARPGYRPQSEDTTEEADRLLMAAYRRLGPAAKWQRVSGDSAAVARAADAGRRLRGEAAGRASVVREAPTDDPFAPALRLVTLAFDRQVKAALYARAGIVEYWVVDLVARGIEVQRTPADGRYGDVVRAAGEDSLSPVAFPDVRVGVDEVFGPAGASAP